MGIFCIGGRNKSKQKFGGMKVSEAEEARKYFINLETETEALDQCANLIWISEKFHASLVKIYCQKQL